MSQKLVATGSKTSSQTFPHAYIHNVAERSNGVSQTSSMLKGMQGEENAVEGDRVRD